MINLEDAYSKIALGIIVFYPAESLIDRLLLACESNLTVYVFDNSPEDSFIRTFCGEHNNCKYFTCGKNVGLGVGLSVICAQSYYHGHDALLFFDQDTVFDRSTLNFVNSFYITKAEIQGKYSAINFNSKKLGKTDQCDIDKFSVTDIVLTINSGSLFFLRNLKIMNWHNVSYFVDGVDYEFCLNSLIHKFKIGECTTTPGFDHQSEQGSREYKIFGRRCFLRIYTFRRISDITISSVRLIYAALRTGNLRFTVNIFNLLIKFIGLQLMIRFKNIFHTKLGNK